MTERPKWLNPLFIFASYLCLMVLGLVVTANINDKFIVASFNLILGAIIGAFIPFIYCVLDKANDN